MAVDLRMIATPGLYPGVHFCRNLSLSFRKPRSGGPESITPTRCHGFRACGLTPAPRNDSCEAIS